jgi:hypothetical protein
LNFDILSDFGIRISDLVAAKRRAKDFRGEKNEPTCILTCHSAVESKAVPERDKESAVTVICKANLPSCHSCEGRNPVCFKSTINN